MSNIFSKNNINAIRVPKVQLSYMIKKLNTLHNILFKLCQDVYYM